MRATWPYPRPVLARADRRRGLDPALIALLVVATALRLYRLDAGMWVDEVSTLVEYVRQPIGYIVTTYASNNQHPLFSVLARASVALFGEHVWSLRLPSVLFGVGSVWAVYALGREVASRVEALLAAAMLTFSYQHVWFSQNARGYAGLLFWSLLSSVFLVRGLRDFGARRAWVSFAVAVALGMYTHLTMLFVVLAQFAVYLWELVRGARARAEAMRVGGWTPFLAGFGLAGVLTLLLYAPILTQIPSASAGDLSNVATWRSPLWLVTETIRGLQFGAAAGVAVGIGVLIVALGTASYLRGAPAIPILLFGSVALGGGTMIALQHHLWPRFFFYAVGFALLVIVRGVFVGAGWAGRLVRLSPQRAQLAATVALLVVISAGARSLQWVYRPKQDFSGALAYIASTRAPDDAVVSVGVAAIAMRQYYAPALPTVDSRPQLAEIVGRSPRTWLLYTLPIEMEESHADLLAMIRRDFRVVRTFDGSLNGGTVYVCLSTREEAPIAAREETP